MGRSSSLPDEQRACRCRSSKMREGIRFLSHIPHISRDPLGSLEVGKHQYVEQLGAGAGPRASRRSRSRRSSSSGPTAETLRLAATVPPVTAINGVRSGMR
jgi:hypothetical protein